MVDHGLGLEEKELFDRVAGFLSESLDALESVASSVFVEVCLRHLGFEAGDMIAEGFSDGVQRSRGLMDTCASRSRCGS